MKTLKFDSVGGASGDMVLGALVDLGVDVTWLTEQLKTLPIEVFSLKEKQVEQLGLHGTKIDVSVQDHDHPHRSFRDIRTMIEASALSDGVKRRAVEVFSCIADAEGHVHNKPPEEVHFHEVGALDSIIDIVGCCCALEKLNVDGVAVGMLPLGSGTVECQHGTYPVPAPATAQILQGFPTVQTQETCELVTPTGAALLTVWRSAENPPAGSRMVKSGYGFGSRTLMHRPCALRATLFETDDISEVSDTCLVLESNMDDTIPELIGALCSQLFAAGALDVFTTPVQMKKQRSGTVLTVLCRPADRLTMLDLIFRESTTFGVREYLVQRTKLARRFETVETSFGSVRVKKGIWQGSEVTFAPEMDDCVQCANERKVPVREVYEAAAQAVRKE